MDVYDLEAKSQASHLISPNFVPQTRKSGIKIKKCLNFNAELQTFKLHSVFHVILVPF